ncbi:AraC family transcriptional regulator [Emticicia sp. W12TSBA100-4]|uniref:helix-turn-helix domain-containing protein n=1 Tax=Emticicia sp. W12TSBA100-4 TaxID=3160965 RepID=UPI0033056FAD
MSQFSFHKGKSTELLAFPHLIEFFLKKTQQVLPSSLPLRENHGLRIIYVLEGKLDWVIDNQQITAFPNDAVLVFPKQKFGGAKEMWDVGVVISISISPRFFSEEGELILGDWSGISEIEQKLIGKLFSLNKKPVLQNFKPLGEILQKIKNEITINELGFKTRINHLLDELLISIARQMSKQDNQRRDFSQTFQKLDHVLRENLAHPWTVEEMAVIVGLGTTAFTEKVKSYSGFSPLNYLINLRISEAIRLLKSSTNSLTDIALDTGFYSSQHFSTTFKKLTGYTPGHYRKNE